MTAQTFRKRYYARKAAGLCTRCGRNPAAEGRTICAACAIYVGIHRKAYTAERISAGRCTRCGKTDGMDGRHKLCQACRDRGRAVTQAIREREKLELWKGMF